MTTVQNSAARKVRRLVAKMAPNLAVKKAQNSVGRMVRNSAGKRARDSAARKVQNSVDLLEKCLRNHTPQAHQLFLLRPRLAHMQEPKYIHNIS